EQLDDALVDVVLLVDVEGGGAPEGSQRGGHEDRTYLRRRAPVALGAVARSRARTSSWVRGRHCPGSRLRSTSGPIRVRTRRRTGCPTASHMRRTWRLRPSWIVMRSTLGSSTATLAGAV